MATRGLLCPQVKATWARYARRIKLYSPLNCCEFRGAGHLLRDPLNMSAAMRTYVEVGIRIVLAPLPGSYKVEQWAR